MKLWVVVGRGLPSLPLARYTDAFAKGAAMNSAYGSMLACIAQFLLCVAGGFWAGYAAEPDSVAVAGGGAFAMTAALFVAYAVAKALGMAMGTALFAQQLLRWLRARAATVPQVERNARVKREDRWMKLAMTATAAAVLMFCSLLVAAVLWAIADGTALTGILLRCLLVATIVSLLMPRALPVVQDVAFGAPPPL